MQKSQPESTEVSRFFTSIPDAKVLLRNRQGSFFGADLYHKQHELFAHVKTGFIKLSPNAGMTSQPGTFWHEIDLPTGTHKTEQGKLVWSPKLTEAQAA